MSTWSSVSLGYEHVPQLMQPCMYRISGHTYCSCNCIGSKLLQSIKLSNMPRNCRGSLLVMMWLILERSANSNWNVENRPSGRWGISTNAQTEENAHISSPPTFLLIKVKVKIKSYEKMKFQSYCYKWHIILINLDKMNAGWKMSRWFWQWTMNTYWTLSRSVSSCRQNTGSWSRQFELCPLFLLQFFLCAIRYHQGSTAVRVVKL